MAVLGLGIPCLLPSVSLCLVTVDEQLRVSQDPISVLVAWSIGGLADRVVGLAALRHGKELRHRFQLA